MVPALHLRVGVSGSCAFTSGLSSSAQMMGSSGHPDLVTGPTDEWWRLVRKGVAAAFSPANIRFARGTSCQAAPCCTNPVERSHISSASNQQFQLGKTGFWSQLCCPKDVSLEYRLGHIGLRCRLYFININISDGRWPTEMSGHFVSELSIGRQASSSVCAGTGSNTPQPVVTSWWRCCALRDQTHP